MTLQLTPEQVQEITLKIQNLLASYVPEVQGQIQPFQQAQEKHGFDIKILTEYKWKGKKDGQGGYLPAPNWGGWEFARNLKREAIEELNKKPIEIGGYTYRLSPDGGMVFRNLTRK